jgi:rhodanese-related sulfurtransferase
MDLWRLLLSVPTLTAADLRRELESAQGAGLVLVDVREPAEYERGHLPGARHIPLGQLAARSHELDPAARTVTY